MNLTDPRASLAEQSSFISYLVGLVGIGRVVRTLAADGNAAKVAAEPATGDFVHMLLGLASVASAIERLVESEPRQANSPPAPGAPTKWLR
jgi:hypothetical protein